MKTNKFMQKSRNMCRIWIVFVILWILWAWLQWIIGFEAGYSNLGECGGIELFIDLFSVVSLGSFGFASLYKVYEILIEHKEFCKNFVDREEIIWHLEIMKKNLLIISGLIGFVWLSGFMAVLNTISFVFLILAIGIYVHYLRQLQEKIG